ncbi:MAG TPA: 50S ribosomal protein L29 [Actinomycetota bacterium]|nr:50S ribosomal protein L29 [Actinomycetota bacterium]
MKVNELRALDVGDLRERLGDVKEELFNLRFQNATGQLDNYARVDQLKKDIARISTLLRERELGIVVEVEEVQPKRRSRRKEKTAESEQADVAEEDEVQEEKDE